jgi:hypothetical protein
MIADGNFIRFIIKRKVVLMMRCRRKNKFIQQSSSTKFRKAISVIKRKKELSIVLASWSVLFKKAIKAGAKPEKDLFECCTNEFDKTEWQHE